MRWRAQVLPAPGKLARATSCLPRVGRKCRSMQRLSVKTERQRGFILDFGSSKCLHCYDTWHLCYQMWGERPQPKSAQYVAKPVKMCWTKKRRKDDIRRQRNRKDHKRSKFTDVDTVWWDFFCCCFVCYRHSLSNNSHSLTVMSWFRDLVRKKREVTRIMSRHWLPAAAAFHFFLCIIILYLLLVYWVC